MASLQERNGRWRAIVRRKGESVSESFLTKSAAKEWARKVEGQIDRGEFRSSQALSVTLGTVIDDYERQLRDNNRRSKTKTSAYRMLRQGLGNRPVATLTSDDVMTHVQKRRASGTGAATLNMEIGFLDELLNYARLKLPVGHPVREARPMLRRLHLIAKPRERTRRPTKDEIDRLKAYWRYPRGKELPMTDIVDFAIGTAMRLGEIVRLRWSDVDARKKLVLVRDSKHPTAKVGNDLWVPLLGSSWDIVLRQPRGEFIFPYHSDAISRAFIRACKACDIEDLHFHDLRHEGASRLFEAGLQIQQVALVTRHRDWKSLKRYTNLRPESLHDILSTEPL